MRQHTNPIGRLIEQHGPDADATVVTLNLTGEVFPRFSNGARWPLGKPLPVEG
jgi:hypothetical protein